MTAKPVKQRAALSFNQLLIDEGLDLRQVRLFRHSQKSGSAGQTPYAVWRTDPEGFDVYNSLMREQQVREARHTAVFVATPAGETLFTVVYEVSGPDAVPQGTICPVTNQLRGNSDGVVWFNARRTGLLAEFEGRLVIDWGPGTRSWSQRANKREKPIVELRARFQEAAFPGWHAFRHRVSELDSLPETWKEVLRRSAGVYLLVHEETGQQYVGAAYGEEGFWSRWMNYALTGHGGNVELRRLGLKPADLVVTVLETAPSTATSGDVIAMETGWKSRLGSRVIGLNVN